VVLTSANLNFLKTAREISAALYNSVDYYIVIYAGQIYILFPPRISSQIQSALHPLHHNPDDPAGLHAKCDVSSSTERSRDVVDRSRK